MVPMLHPVSHDLFRRPAARHLLEVRLATAELAAGFGRIGPGSLDHAGAEHRGPGSSSERLGGEVQPRAERRLKTTSATDRSDADDTGESWREQSRSSPGPTSRDLGTTNSGLETCLDPRPDHFAGYLLVVTSEKMCFCDFAIMSTGIEKGRNGNLGLGGDTIGVFISTCDCGGRYPVEVGQRTSERTTQCHPSIEDFLL
jgi:hypothetical protein